MTKVADSRFQDDYVRELKGICNSFASASTVDELDRALQRWLRVALRARTFSYALYAAASRSRSLELVSFEGILRGGTELDTRRQQAFAEKCPVRAQPEDNRWETALFLPMVAGGESLGVLELAAPTAAIDGSLETLEAIAAQGAIVLRHLRDVSSLSNEIQEATKLNEIREARLNTGIALTAHEIKSPLLGTLAVMQVLEQMGADKSKQTDLLRQAQRQLEDLAALTDELMSSTFGDGELSMSVVNMAELVDEVIATFPEGDRRRVAVHGSLDATVHGNLLQLRNALRHVIYHALRHTSKDQVIGVRVGRGDSSSLVTVTDGGPRIPPSERENLFDPFARDGRGVRSMDSLCLFAARRIVEGHGGEITVDSGDTGTSFMLELPALTREAQSVLS
jgi:signal transduction histidine kinase